MPRFTGQVKELLADLHRCHQKQSLTSRYRRPFVSRVTLVLSTNNAGCDDLLIYRDSDTVDNSEQLQQTARASRQLKAQLRSSHRRIAGLERELQQCQGALSNTRHALLQAQTELVTVKNRCRSLEVSLASWQQDQRQSEGNGTPLASPFTTTHELQITIRELQAQLNIEKAASSRQSAEVEDAHRRYLSTQKALAEATAQLAKLEQAVEHARVQAVRKEEAHQKTVEQLHNAQAVLSEELKSLKTAADACQDVVFEEKSKNKALQR